MQVFHVSDCFAPRTGGIESQVRDLARAQVAAGHTVHVLTATPGPEGERGGVVQDDDGVLVHRLGTRMPFDLPVNPAAPPAVRRLLAEHRPDVVHVHAGVLSPFAYDGARVALTAGMPTAITWHCMLDGAVPALRAVVRRSSWSSHVPAALSAVSHAAAARVAEVFGAPVEIVPNGMDLARWAPPDDGGAASVAERSVPGRSTAAPVPLRCVATMRLAPRKRAATLVDLVGDAAGQLSPGALRLDVIGDGPVRAALARRIRRRSLDDVITLRGRLPRESVRAAYRDVDVFIAPAVLEAFGIAALEARTAGLVVLARRGTGIEEFVTHGVDGLLADDDACLARHLVRLVREPDLLARLRRQARVQPPVFDWGRAVAAAEAEYLRARRLNAAAVALR